jgi:hypothetical protein
MESPVAAAAAAAAGTKMPISVWNLLREKELLQQEFLLFCLEASKSHLQW